MKTANKHDLANKDALKDEKNIVWKEDLDNYPWVRESSTEFLTKQGIAKNRQTEIEKGGRKLIGYSELEEDAPSSFTDKATGRKYFYRRIFTIGKDDYENYKKDYPTEAVDPLTAEPKTLGLSPKKNADSCKDSSISSQKA